MNAGDTTAADHRPGILEAFSRAIDRETHYLSRWPELVWQQLHNRLRWEDDPIPATLEAWAREAAAAMRPWLSTRAPFPEGGALIRTLRGHTRPVTACAVSPDGSYIVSAAWDQTVRVWDAETGLERFTLAGHTGPVEACALSPDGRFVVSASSDNTLKLWESETGVEMATLSGHTGAVYGCAVSPDGQSVVSASWDTTLRVWDVASRTTRHTLQGHGSKVSSCAVSPDGTLIASTGWGDGTLLLWEAGTGSEVARLTEDGGVGARYLMACAFAPDGSFVVAARADGTLKAWAVPRGEELATIQASADTANGCAVSPDGSFVVSADNEGRVTTWDVGTWTERGTLRGHAGPVNACFVSPDGELVVSAGGDSLKVWDAEARGDATAPPGHIRFVTTCAFGPDGSFAVSAGDDGTLKLWDAESGNPNAGWQPTGPMIPVMALAVSPSGTYVASGSGDGTVKLWDPQGGGERATLQAPGAGKPVAAVAISPDGSLVLSAGGDGVKAWGAETGARRTIPTEISPLVTEYVNARARGLDGALALSSAEDGMLALWEVRSGPHHSTMRVRAAEPCAISPDGSLVVAAQADRALGVWDARTGKRTLSLTGHDAAIKACAVAPDGRWIFSAGRDGTLRVWDAGTGAETAILPLGPGIWSMAMHPYRPRVVCGDEGGNVSFFDVARLEYGPIVVTAVDAGKGPGLRCPKCRHDHPLDETWLDQVIDCPTPTCDLTLRVNPLVVTIPAWLRDEPAGEPARQEFGRAPGGSLLKQPPGQDPGRD